MPSIEYDAPRALSLARADRALLDAYYTQRNTRFAGRSGILEFCCGVTGGSDWLAEGGPMTIADLSAPQLIAARDRLNAKSFTRATLTLLGNRTDIDALPCCDLLYCALTTRTAPPTVLVRMLGLLLSKVLSGGAALLHLPTQHRHYQLMLQDAQDLRDLNVIPQWTLFELFEALQFSIVLVQENAILRASDIVYHSMLVQRRDLL